MQIKILKQNSLKYYIAMSHLTGVSPIFKAKLFEYFDFDIERAFLCKKEDLVSFCDIYPNVPISRTFFQKRYEIDADLELEYAIKKGYKFLTYEDENYPQILKEIPDFPLMLYYKGNLEEINFSRTLAIVGSRRASESSKNALAKIISGMKNSDITIVSGLAYGIDAQAHKSAIENNLKTVGIIGTGLDTIYPNSNKALYEKIENGCGVVMSEFPPKMPPLPHNFPQRNRIVTGLSFGTLVAEAAMKSGAMISANLTLEQNRELMCMPGLISNPNCEGIYHLLKNGAGMVTCADDVFDCLGWEMKQVEKELVLNEKEKTIYNIISIEPKSFDIIAQEAEIDLGELMVCLTQMELQGLIKQTNSRYYISN